MPIKTDQLARGEQQRDLGPALDLAQRLARAGADAVISNSRNPSTKGSSERKDCMPIIASSCSEKPAASEKDFATKAGLLRETA
jgi:hypothetical protein